MARRLHGLVMALGILGVLGLGLGIAGRPAYAADASTDLPAGQLKFRVFGGLDGLKNLVVVSIAQDGLGFLWLGTEDGVYRFDGERFTHFSVEEGLVSSSATVVAVAPDGEVCVGSRTGLVCWDGSRFSRAKARGVPAVAIQKLVSYAGKLWVGTDGSGLYVQDPSGGFVPAPGWPAEATTLRALWADGNGLVAGAETTVMRSSGDGVWHDIGDVGLEHERVDGVLRDHQGALWIRTQAHMWLLPEGASHAIDLSDGLPTGYDVSTGATAMVIGPRGDVLVGTDDGIAYRDRDHWRMINRSSGMPGATIRTLFMDREGSLWIGSAGLVQLRGRGVVEYYNVPNGLPGDTVWGYRRDREGTLWVGTSRCLARAVARRWECMPGTEGRVVRTMVFPPQGGVFIGGAPGDLLYIDAAGHAVSIGDFELPPGHNILALALGPDGDLWIATRRGLYRLPGAVPGPLEQIVVPGVPPSARFAALTVADGRLWSATTRGGVVVLDQGEWRVFGTTAGFRSSAMSYVMQRADGRLCATYIEAIGFSCFRYDGHGVVDLEHIGRAQGLTAAMVYFLGEDPHHRLWVGTGDGVDILTPQGVDHFDESDGLAGNDTAAMAFLVDPDGSIWLGSTGGATHVFAQHYAGPPVAPRTAVLGGRLGDEPIRAAGNESTVREVPHDRNALTLELATSSMLDAKRIEYQMRMSPLETAWTTTHQRQAHYPGLLPGAYSFEVRARLGAGPWGLPTALRFTILPAWWQARWFIALVVIAGLATIGLLFTWRQRALLRRRTRQLNEQAEASFRAVIDLMPDLMSVYRERVLTYCNTACCRFLGIDQATTRWNEISAIDWIHPDDRDQVTEMFARVRDLESQRGFEVIEPRSRSADGSWRFVELSAVRVEIGNATTVVASARDVTERKRMRAKLLVSDRMASLGTLAAGIAHEINNPLAYVTGNLEAMAETLEACEHPPTPADRDQLATAISDARDGAERVRKIVQGLRSFSRSEEERRVPLALPGVIEAAIRLTSNEVRHRAQLVQELGATPLVIADDGRLTQVFINLLVNAAHAIPEGRSDANRITVRTRTDDQGRAVIEVEDTGKGILPELQARVFDPFFTTKDVGEGTGLGLSICHGIVSGLGGQISIETPALGGSKPASGSGAVGGTVVRVVLPPAVQPVATATVLDSPVICATNGHRRHRVMLVDDEPMVVHTMERLLRRDYDVTVALCGQEAIDHIAGGARFDAIVSDVMMPNMTGIELIEQLQRVAPEQAQRLIFLSGGAFTAETRERLAELGAPQLEKPVTAKELRACVLRVTSDAGVVSQ
jgi:PAS domain S-box-containing protein